MISLHELHCYDYVNRPYREVSEALRMHPREVFASATGAAATRARDLAANLRLELGGLEIGTQIAVEVLAIETSEQGPGKPPTTTIKLAWRAARAPALFPSMKAELVAYPLTPHETQLELRGSYRPPLGALGDALDAAVGYRVAAASVQRFVEDIAKHLRAGVVPSAAANDSH